MFDDFDVQRSIFLDLNYLIYILYAKKILEIVFK